MGCLLLLSLFDSWGCQSPPFPTIDRLDPATGQIGESVRIYGSSLDYRTALYVGDQVIDDLSIASSNDQLLFSVPTGLRAGDVEVHLQTEEGPSNVVSFRVLPSILSVEPTIAAAGEEVLITTNFLKTDLSLRFAESIAPDVDVRDYEIRVVVPDSATSGPLEILLPGQRSIVFPDFQVKGAPKLEVITPSYGWPGREVTLTGRNFLDDVTQVIFAQDKAVEIQAGTLTQLTVIVPSGLDSGRVKVHVINPYGRDSIDFVSTPIETEGPFVSKVFPSALATDCAITLTGGNFDAGAPSVSFTGENGIIEVSGNELDISPAGDQLVVTVPPGAITGDVVVTTVKGGSPAVALTIVPMPVLNQVLPAKNDLGGQVILDVTGGQAVQSVFFGAHRISPANGAFAYRQFSANDEIIATNVPLSASRTNEVIYLEVAAGCFSDSLPFEIVTSQVSANAPLAGGSQTVVIPAGVTGISFINNEWTSIRGDFRDPDNLNTGLLSWSFCACLDSVGNVWLFEPFPDCHDNYGYENLFGAFDPIPCDLQPEFQGQVPVGKISGSKVDIFGQYVGRVDARNAPYGAKTIVLSPVGYGDQIEITFPDFISSVTPASGPPGTEIILNGRFNENSVVELLFGNNLTITQQRLAYNQFQVTIPDDLDFVINSALVVEIHTRYFDGTESNYAYFELTGPHITSLSPTSGPVGTTVTLTGDFFLQTPTDNRLRLSMGTEPIPFTILSDTQLSFTIPAILDPGTGSSTYQTVLHYFDSDVLESNQVPFTVTP